MLEGGLSIQICFLHVLTTAGCCGSMLLPTLSVAATFISKGTSKVVQGNARKMSRAEYIKLSSTLRSPSQLWPSCIPGFTYSQPPNSLSLSLQFKAAFSLLMVIAGSMCPLHTPSVLPLG